MESDEIGAPPRELPRSYRGNFPGCHLLDHLLENPSSRQF
jgi:hypothetical protein